MSERAVIYMSNGKTYTISNSPGTIASQLDNSASESDLLRSFELVNGKKSLSILTTWSLWKQAN